MAIKMLKCFDGSELSEREMAAVCIPQDMLPLTPEEREEYKRLQEWIQTSRANPADHSAALQEAASFILAVIVPYRLAMEKEARLIDEAELAQQAR